MEGNCDSSLLDQNMEMIAVKDPNVTEVPLKEDNQKSWLEFKKLDEGRPVIEFTDFEEDEGRWPLELYHPFTSVIGDFAIAAFNEIIEAYVKKDNSNNLRCAEIMDCKYVTVEMWTDTHFFFLDIEAIEEGILGVYRAMVACYAIDGRRTLVSLYLTDRKPTGKIAVKMSHLIFLKSRYKNMKAVKEHLEINLEKTHKSLQGKKKKGKVVTKLIRLEGQYKDVKGICATCFIGRFGCKHQKLGKKGVIQLVGLIPGYVVPRCIGGVIPAARVMTTKLTLKILASCDFVGVALG